MKDFNLQKYLRENPLTKQGKVLSKGKINEAFEGFGGVKDPSVVGDGVRKQTKDFDWDPTDSANYDEQSQPNKWIADIDRTQPAYGDWKASWEHPGLIVWSHADIPDAVVVATPGWDGKGTPVEFQSQAGSTQMLKVLDQDVFPNIKAYIAAIAPYLDMVEDANLNPTGEREPKGASEFQGVHEDHSDLSQDGKMATSKIGPIIHPDDMKNENDYFDRRKVADDDYDEMEEPSRISGLVDQRELAKFAEAVMAIAQDLDDEGFDSIDIKKFLKDQLDDMIIA